MKQLGNCALCRILLRWSSWGNGHSAGYYWNGAVGLRCIVQDNIEMEQLAYCVMQDIIEMEQLGYFVQWGIILKLSNWGTVQSAGYYWNAAVGLRYIVLDINEMVQLRYSDCAGCYWNGAVGVLCVMQDIFEMEQLGYYMYSGILLKWSRWGTLHTAGYNWNGAVGVRKILQDNIQMEHLVYCV